jgi:hypothetical protein
LPKVEAYVNELLTWGLPLSLALALYGLCYSTLQTASHDTDYWIARTWFALATLVCFVRLLFWGITAPSTIELRVAVCLMVAMGLAAITIASFKSISAKHQASKLRITTTPHTFSETVNRKQIAETINDLSEFAEEGNKLILRNKERARDVEWSRAEEWARQSEAYLKQHVSEEEAAYFSLATTKPYPGLAVDRRSLFVNHRRRVVASVGVFFWSVLKLDWLTKVFVEEQPVFP